MKTTVGKVVACAFCLVLAESTFGQIYSSNIVGYYNSTMQPGVNLIADQFLSSPDNTLDSILNAGTSSGGLANNTAFTMWSNGAFLPWSIYNASLNSWSINYSLNLGQSGYLNSPASFVNTFVGSVGPYFQDGNPYNINWNPNYPNGLQLISDPIPRAGTLDTEFFNVTGRNPVNGEGVAILDPLTQTYNISYYTSGIGWQNQALTGPSTASLNVGDSAWFDLGANYNMPSPLPVPVPVPEPGMLALAGLGSLALLIFRRRQAHQVEEF
jgi:PEP-CTERM motif-containing protein